MNPLVLIPARMAATRLPGKPLADIGGQPMIVRAWRRAASVLAVAIVAVSVVAVARRASPAYPVSDNALIELATINALAAHPDPVTRLTAAGEIGYRADEPAAAALSRIARDAIELLAGSTAARVRECAAPDCAFLFLDTSRAGRRRWCAMARCGNREHVRKHRRRLSNGAEVAR